MKRKVFGVLVGLVAMGAVASAAVAPCPTGKTLADYIALGATGCQIDDKVFSNFAYSGGQGGVPQAGQVNVTPDNTPFNPGVNFGANWTLFGPNLSEDFHLSFTVDVLAGGRPIGDDSLGIDIGQVVGVNSLITVNETVCLGGNFTNPAGGTGCTNPTSSLSAFDASNSNKTFDHNIFLPASYTHIQVFKDIGLQTGLCPNSDTNAACVNPVANFSSLSQNFSEVPEPMTLSMMGLGLLGLGLVRRRQPGKK